MPSFEIPPTTLLAVAGIGLGVALILASLAVGGGVERSVERTVETMLGRADFRVSAVGGGTLSEETLVTVRSVLGVEVAAPAVEYPTTLVPEADAAAPPSRPVVVLGIDPILDGQVHQLDLVGGSALTRRDEAAAIITERLADEDGYGLGSDVIVATPGEPERFRVVGIVAGDGPLAGSGGRTVILPMDAVTRMFGLEGVASVDLLIESGVPLEGVQAELGEALAAEPYVLTSPTSLAASLRSSVSAVAVAVAAIAALGVVVGALVVFVAVRLTAGGREAPASDRGWRRTAGLAAIGAVVGVVVGTVLGALTTPDIAPTALGLPGIAAGVAIAVLLAVAGMAWSPGRPIDRLVAAAPVGGLLVIAGLAIVAANLQGNSVEPSGAPVAARIAGQLGALALLAALMAGLWIASVFLARRPDRARSAWRALVDSTRGPRAG